MIRVQPQGRVEATAGVLREIITIVLGLAFTGAVVTFLTQDGFKPIKVSDITVPRVLIFMCVLPTIVRFYHGNVNHLNFTYSVSDKEADIRHYPGKLAIDFVVFLIQAIIFSALAIFQSQTRDFFALFIYLFIVDAVWCLINVWFSGWTFREFEGSLAHHHLRTQINWMLTNSAAAILIIVLLTSKWGDTDCELPGLVPYFFGIITLNAAVDY